MIATGKIISGSMKPVQSTYMLIIMKEIVLYVCECFFARFFHAFRYSNIPITRGPVYSPVYWSIWKVSPTQNGTGQ
jgi:hypothetical protein